MHSYKEADLVEKYGFGIKRIIQAFTEYDLPIPHFEEFQHGFRVMRIFQPMICKKLLDNHCPAGKEILS